MAGYLIYHQDILRDTLKKMKFYNLYKYIFLNNTKIIIVTIYLYINLRAYYIRNI